MRLMKFETLANNVSKLAGRKGLIVQKNSPEILLFFGITGIVLAGVLACRSTLKVEEVIDDHKSKTDMIKFTWEKVKEGEISYDEYSERDYKKDLTVAYTQTAVQFIGLYGPPIALGVVSIACIVSGHNIMKRRNLALMAAYKTVHEGFSAYRRRVIEEHGEEADYMYRHGLRSEVVTEIEVDENGKAHKVEKTKLIAAPEGHNSMYARFFDESCLEWGKDPQYNLMYVHGQQTHFNEMLQARGHVFLNEVYDALGIPRTEAGAIVGWVLGSGGDDYIDFGIFNGDSERARAFVNGHERSILLDFNVDGVIHDKI